MKSHLACLGLLARSFLLFYAARQLHIETVTSIEHNTMGSVAWDIFLWMFLVWQMLKNIRHDQDDDLYHNSM